MDDKGRYIEVDGLRVGPCMWRDMVERAEQAEAERDAALRAVAGLIRWANSDGAGGGYPPVELTPAVIDAARKLAEGA